MVDRSLDGTTITIRGSNTIDRPGGGKIIANTRPGASNFVDTRPAGNFVDTHPGGNFVSSRSGAGNFVNARPAAGNLVNTNSRPAGGIIVFGHPNGVNVINRASGVVVSPRVAPVLPNFSLPVAPAMRGIRPGVGPIPFNRAVIGRGPASGGAVGGAMARPGGFGGGGFGGALPRSSATAHSGAERPPRNCRRGRRRRATGVESTGAGIDIFAVGDAVKVRDFVTDEWALITALSRRSGLAAFSVGW